MQSGVNHSKVAAAFARCFRSASPTALIFRGLMSRCLFQTNKYEFDTKLPRKPSRRRKRHSTVQQKKCKQALKTIPLHMASICFPKADSSRLTLLVPQHRGIMIGITKLKHGRSDCTILNWKFLVCTILN